MIFKLIFNAIFYLTLFHICMKCKHRVDKLDATRSKSSAPVSTVNTTSPTALDAAVIAAELVDTVLLLCLLHCTPPRYPPLPSPTALLLGTLPYPTLHHLYCSSIFLICLPFFFFFFFFLFFFLFFHSHSIFGFSPPE